MEVDGWQVMTLHGEGAVRRIYIEGDGRAYISRDTPSGDPTPRNPVALKLALADKEEGAMYVARPCQWVKGPQCKDNSVWTTLRFNEAVARVYAEVVRRASKSEPVELVGYSGGAWVALQAAARLDNVTKVTTVAGNLMPNWVNAQHKVSKMYVAEYPKGRLVDVPVTAYVGIQDTVVGSGVVSAYQMATEARLVDVVEVQATHAEGWERLWGF
jgi:dienelactone hydrolase